MLDVRDAMARGLKEWHLLDGRDAMARGKRWLGVPSRAQEAGEIACPGWMWLRKIRWCWEVEGSKWTDEINAKPAGQVG